MSRPSSGAGRGRKGSDEGRGEAARQTGSGQAGRSRQTGQPRQSGQSRQTRRSRRPRRPRPETPRDYTFSPSQLAARAAALPVMTYPDLPVSARRGDIAAAIRENQVVIVAGETGSGKTTQLPKICLELGRGISAMIGHTQPRRLAARAVAERIADELGQKVSKEVGDIIGYQVRFTDEVGPTTLVKLMTDGILLAEMSVDPLLSRYDTIIVDEAHERSLNIDFILGYLSRLLPKRPDLKVIITSATIDSQRFAEHFEKHSGKPVPVIEVSGRAYPVEIRYRPLSADVAPTETGPAGSARGAGEAAQADALDTFETLGYGLGEDLDLETGLLHAVDELLTEDRGDILVFLPGERDILDATAALKEHLGSRYVRDPRDPHGPNGVEIVPLFARLSAAEQHRIYAPHSLQRIILSTNIAETSLTVPGIRYVIDAGLARISRFSNKTKVQRLPIEPVSRASAAQRSGRAGRTSDGIAIRLYSERDFNARDEFTEPEILRTSLAAVILQMASLGLGEVKDFPFLDPPNPRAVRDGVQLLVEIGALSPAGAITALGRRLAQLPIDPRLGRMLIEASNNGCASEVLVIVAALSIQDPRERPVDFQEQADQAHRRFADPSSDFITYLNMWRYLNVQARDLSGSAFRRMCRKEYFHYLRYREWRDIVGQLRQMCRQVGIHVDSLGMPSRSFIDAHREEQNPVISAVSDYGRSAKAVDAQEIHRSILSGLLSNVGSWDEPKKEYAGTRGSRFTIWPGSTLKRRRPDWVMAAELVETSRLFARTVAGVKPEWIEKYAQNLVKKSYSEPTWSRAKGSAVVNERVMLYGLTLVADRQVPLASLKETILGKDWSRSGLGSVAGATAQMENQLSSQLVDELDTARRTGLNTQLGANLTASALAREMFITHALVEGAWRDNHLAFMKRNRDVMAEAERLSERMRDPALVPDEAVRYRFFDARVPAYITSAASFGKWWKGKVTEAPHLLDYHLEDLLPAASLADPSAFPQTWEQGDLKLAVSYAFDPGANEDGVSITIPLSSLGRVQDTGFDWLVPGLLEDLCVAMIRGLPKAKRRFLAPATQTGKEIAATLERERLVDEPAGHSGTGRDSGTDGQGGRGEGAVVDGGAVGGGKTDGGGSGSGADGDTSNPYSLEASLARLQSWGAQSGSMRMSSNRPASTTPAASARSSSTPAPSAGPPRSTPVPPAGPPPSTTPPSPPKDSPRAASRKRIRARTFDEEFARAVRGRTGIDLAPSDLAAAHASLPAHLKMGFRVVDDNGAILGADDSLIRLQKRFRGQSTRALQSSVKEALEAARAKGAAGPAGGRGAGPAGGRDAGLADGPPGGPGTGTARSGAGGTAGGVSARTTPPELGAGLVTSKLDQLPQEGLPQVVEATDARGLRVRGYPALVTQKVAPNATVSVQILPTRDEANAKFADGLAALLLADLALETGRITSRWSGNQALLLAGSPYPDTPSLVADAQVAALRQLLRRKDVTPHTVRDQESYVQLRDSLRDLFEDEVYQVLTRVTTEVQAYARLEEALANHPQDTYKRVTRAARNHAKSIFQDGYLGRNSLLIAPHVSRYLLADARRVERGARGAKELSRDLANEKTIREVEAALAEAQARLEARPYSAAHALELEGIMSAAEELRVSLFAQDLGTSGRVSAPRLLRRLETLESA